MNHDDGPQSSEEGSGMHSPVLYGAAPGDSFRYQHDPIDVQQAPAILTASPYHEYSLAAQQNQIVLDNSGRHLPYSNSHYLPHSSPPSHPPRGHLGLDRLDIHADPRLPSPAQASGSAVDWYGHMRERPLPGGPTQDHVYPRPSGTSVAMSMNPDHRTQHVVAAPTERVEHSAPSPSAPSSTERRKEASNVVIACRQCRARKIRCDSTRPGCNNCARRNNQCEYDAVPKRRGPDKRPGTRQRSCKKRPPPDGTNPPPPTKRKKTTADRSQPPADTPQPRAKDGSAMSQSNRSPTSVSSGPDRVQAPLYQYGHHPNTSPTTELRLSNEHSFPVKLEHSPTYRRDMGYDQGSYAKSSYSRQLDINAPYPPLEAVPRNISLQPLNAILAEQLNANWSRLLKANPVQVIVQEIAFVVDGTGHYLSFINVQNLEKMLWQEQYTRIHPGFIWAALALANLMRSSTHGRGQQGLEIAIALYSEAKSALDIPWADATYAYAALIVALFESSAQPNYSHARALNALVELDDYIHQMRLTMNDAHHPDVTTYDGIPVIYYPSDRENLDSRKPCPCVVSSPIDLYTSSTNRTYIPRWDPTWTLDQIRAEEVRRLCWSALSLVSAFLAQAATDNRRMPQFHLSDPRSYRLLFPGEVLDRLEPAFNHSDGLTTKESVWALYCRSMLLWNYSNRFRHLSSTEDEGVSEEIAEVMAEAQTIDESLDMHKCNLDSMLIFTTREHTHNIRMVVTQAMRVLQGYDRGVRSPGAYFKRKHAEDWVQHQEKIVRQVVNVINNLNSPEAIQLTERPFRVQWFFHQLSTCLQLWEVERTLDEALHLGKRLLQIVDTMNYLWDCPENRTEAVQLRGRLTDACRLTGVEPPYSPRQMTSIR